MAEEPLIVTLGMLFFVVVTIMSQHGGVPLIEILSIFRGNPAFGGLDILLIVGGIYLFFKNNWQLVGSTTMFLFVFLLIIILI